MVQNGRLLLCIARIALFQVGVSLSRGAEIALHRDRQSLQEFHANCRPERNLLKNPESVCTSSFKFIDHDAPSVFTDARTGGRALVPGSPTTQDVEKLSVDGLQAILHDVQVQINRRQAECRKDIDVGSSTTCTPASSDVEKYLSDVSTGIDDAL